MGAAAMRWSWVGAAAALCLLIGNAAYFALSGKKAPSALPTLVVVIPGQSNATNQAAVGGFVSEHSNCLVVDMNTAALSACNDPVVPLVIGNYGGSFIPRLGDLLAASGKFDRVILAPIAVGGTYSFNWIPGG
jgi:hypothetical protein